MKQKAIDVTAETRWGVRLPCSGSQSSSSIGITIRKKINRSRAAKEVKIKTLDWWLNYKTPHRRTRITRKSAEAEKAASERKLFGKFNRSFVHDTNDKKSSTFRDEENKLRDKWTRLTIKNEMRWNLQCNEKEKEMDGQKETLESMTWNLDSANIRLREEIYWAKCSQAVTEKASLDLIKG